MNKTRATKTFHTVSAAAQAAAAFFREKYEYKHASKQVQSFHGRNNGIAIDWKDADMVAFYPFHDPNIDETFICQLSKHHTW